MSRSAPVDERTLVILLVSVEVQPNDIKYRGPDRLLLELGLPFSSGPHAKLAMASASALDPIEQLMVAAGGSFAKGQQPTAMLHLFARSISDLVAGLHLLSHCYVQQAHSVIRPVQESCDLLDLFAARPELAAEWMAPETSWTEFRPQKVREKLGQLKPDEIYGHFSEIGPHPRFAGMQVAGGMLQGPDGEAKAIIRIGPFFPQHPATVTVYGLVLQHALLLTQRGVLLAEISTRVTELDWLKAYRSCLVASATASVQIRQALIKMDAGEGAEFMETAYDEGLRQVDQLIAAEE